MSQIHISVCLLRSRVAKLSVLSFYLTSFSIALLLLIFYSSQMLPLFYFILYLCLSPCLCAALSVTLVLQVSVLFFAFIFFPALVFVIFFIINVILGIFSWQSDCYYYSDVFSIFLIFPLSFFYTPFVLFEPLSYECALAWAEL